MFTPKTALFTFFAACALGVVACQPADLPPPPLTTRGNDGASAAPVLAPPSAEQPKTAAR